MCVPDLERYNEGAGAGKLIFNLKVKPQAPQQRTYQAEQHKNNPTQPSFYRGQRLQEMQKASYLTRGERRITKDGEPSYVDQINKRTTWSRPAL